MSCTYGNPSRVKYNQEHPKCGTNSTCYPLFCDSYVNATGMVDSADVVNNICNGLTDTNGKKWGIEGCIRDVPDYPDYQLYYTTMYCDNAKCYVDGGTEGSCGCHTFHTLCEMFGDTRKYTVSHHECLSISNWHSLIDTN